MLLSIAKSMFVFELFHLIHTHTKNPGRCIRVRMFEIFALLRKHEPEHGIIRNITQVFKVPGLFKLGKAHFQNSFLPVRICNTTVQSAPYAFHQMLLNIRFSAIHCSSFALPFVAFVAIFHEISHIFAFIVHTYISICLVV